MECIYKNLGVIAAGTGIFAAVYQYHVVGDGGETVKLLMSALAADMALLLAYNQWNPSLYMKTLRDSVMNYLGNNLSNRFAGRIGDRWQQPRKFRRRWREMLQLSGLRAAVRYRWIKSGLSQVRGQTRAEPPGRGLKGLIMTSSLIK